MKKMQHIADAVRSAIDGILPYIRITVDDDLLSNVGINTACQPKEAWVNGIFHNSEYTIIMISSANGKQYYDGGDVTLELTSKSHKIGQKLRKYTGSVEKVVEKLKKYLELVAQEYKG